MTGPPPTGPGTVPRDTRNTDLGFWGKRVIQGRYHGFRVIDVSNYRKPVELAYFQRVSPAGPAPHRGPEAQQSTPSC